MRRFSKSRTKRRPCPLDYHRDMNIAIIGAGMAGAAAARTLSAYGHVVQLFDKSRGAGGRLMTKRQFGIDHGAQYFTARSPAFVQQVQEWQAAGVVSTWAEQGLQVWEAGGARISAGEQRYVGTPSMHQAVKHGLHGQTLHASAWVTGVEGQPGAWRLQGLPPDHSARDQVFDAVLWTLPLPQLLAQAAPLPSEWQTVWADVRMTPCWAAWWRGAVPLGHPDRPWAPQRNPGVFVNDDPMVSWLAHNGSKAGRQADAWTLHTTATWSQLHLDDSPESVADAVGAWLREHGWYLSELPHVHRWRFARVQGQAQQSHLWDASLGLGVAGDWLMGGRVEGAWRSGVALAHAVLD